MPPDRPDSWAVSLLAAGTRLDYRTVLSPAPIGRLLVNISGAGSITGQWVSCQNCGPIPTYGTSGVLQGYNPPHCVGYVAVNGSSPGTCGSSAGIGGKLLVADSLVVTRASGPFYSEPNCGFDCIEWTGSEDILITRVAADLDLKALNPATGQSVSQVFWGTDVRFEMKATPWSVDGIQLPLYPKGWTWSGDPSDIPEKTSITGIYGCSPTANACAPRIYESGAMEGAAYVNGKGIRKTVHITVRRRRLLLNVTPSTVVRRGTVLTFNGTRDDGSGGSYTAPAWTISDPSAVTSSGCNGAVWTCSETAQKNYTRSVSSKIDDSLQTVSRQIVVYSTFRIQASKTTAKVGDTVTFTAYLDDSIRAIPRWQWKGVDVPSCANSSECRQVMDTLGTLTMTGWTASSGGESATATTSVTGPVLSLTASPGAVNEREVVTFKLTVDGAPKAPNTWRFVPDSQPGDASACASGISECLKVMRGSGTMWATYSVQKVRDSAFVHVTVLGSCPATSMMSVKGDSIVGTPCGTAGPNGGSVPSPRRYVLTVIRSPGLLGSPLPADTNGAFVFDSGAVVQLDFSTRQGFRDLFVVVDDTLRLFGDSASSFQGTVVMDRDHDLIVEASQYVAPSAQVRAYADSIHSLLYSVTPPEALERYLGFVARELTQRGSAAEPDFAFAEELAINPSRDWSQIFAFESAINAREYSLSGNETLHVALIGGPGINARRAPPQARSVTSVSRETRVTYVNGIFNSASDASGSAAKLAQAIRGLGIATNDSVSLLFNPSFKTTWEDDVDKARKLCVQSIPVIGVLESIRAKSLRNRQCMRASWINTSTFRSIPLKFSLALEEADSTVRDWLDVQRAHSRASSSEIVGEVRAKMVEHHTAGVHSIWVGHSRGNMTIARALGYAGDSIPGLQSGSCTAVLALAPPIDIEDLNVPFTLRRGITLKGDILWQLNLTDVPILVTNEGGSIGKLNPNLWNVLRGIDLHSTSNYFSEEPGKSQVRSELVALRNACFEAHP